MARDIKLGNKDEREAFGEVLFRSIQSAHLNFLIGAGASCPGVGTAWRIEAEIAELVAAGNFDEANKRSVQFLKQFKKPMIELIEGQPSKGVEISLKQYISFIQAIDAILSERKNNLLPRQASVFTTNYDLFVESAAEQCPSIILNDGFNRVPSLRNIHKFAPEKLFDATLHTGDHYGYTAELPSINLIKLHGSISWQNVDKTVVYRLLDFAALDALKESDSRAIATFIQNVAIVLPTQRKYQQTLIERVYYDLLRIFANVMERENSLLIAFGFSFRDEHIMEVVKRALRNPTLKLIISCFAPGEVQSLRDKFASYNNVSLIVPENEGELTFNKLVELLSQVAPVKGRTNAG